MDNRDPSGWDAPQLFRLEYAENACDAVGRLVLESVGRREATISVTGLTVVAGLDDDDDGWLGESIPFAWCEPKPCTPKDCLGAGV